MATDEAELPETILSNKIAEKDKESIGGESESFKETPKVEGDVGICEGGSFLVSPSLAKVANEITCIDSESTVVDEKVILQQKEKIDNETQLLKDLKQEAVQEAYGITGEEEAPLNIDEGNETWKKKVILGQEVETTDGQASTRELPYNIEEVKAANHSQEDKIEEKKSSNESELELGEKVHETSKGTTGQNQEALPFTPGLMGEILKIDVKDIREVWIKDATKDDAPIKQEVEKSVFEGVRCKGQEKSSHTEGKETGPTTVNSSEKIGENTQEGHENPHDNNTDCILKGEESSKIQDGEEIVNNTEGTNESFHIPPTKFITEETSLDKFEQESGKIEQSCIALEEKSKETADSHETSKDKNPGENENPDDDWEIPLVTEEKRLDKSEQEAGKLEEKDENSVEYEIQDTEALESPLVTQVTEGSHFQEQDKPYKIEETSETESANTGKDNCNQVKPQDKILETAESTISEEAKDDESPETKLDTSSIKDEEGLEGLERGSEKLVFPLTNTSIDENKDKGGPSVTETRDNIEVTEIIGAEEICRWQMPKEMEASEQSLQTDKPEEEKLEKSLDVVSEAVEAAASSADAEGSTYEKEEKPINSVEESFEEERKEGNTRDDEVNEHRTPKDENLRAVEPSQKIEKMELETPNTEMGNSPVTHSLVEESIQQECEQEGEVSNLEVEEQVHKEDKNAPVENKHTEEAFRIRENIESTMLEQEKSRDGAQTLELIPQASEMEVEETVKVSKIDSKERSTDTDASQRIEEQTEKNEEASEIGMGKTITKGEAEKMIIKEDCCIPEQGTVFFGIQTDDQNSHVEEKKAAPEFSGEEQSCITNETDKATKNEINNKEVSAEPKIAGAGEDTEKHIIEESIIMAQSTESMKGPLKQSSQGDEIMKKHEEEVHRVPHTECEFLEKSSTGENTERQTVVENSAAKDHCSPPIQEETVTESSQEDEVSERLETTGVGEETERSILEEDGAVTDTCMLSVVGMKVKENLEEDQKEEENPKEDITDSDAGNFENMEDTKKNADASGATETSREEILQKEHSEQFMMYEEHSKEDIKKTENNNEQLETESARTLQEAKQEGRQLVDGSNLASEKSSLATTETSSTSFQQVDVKGVKLEETHNQSDNSEKALKVEKQVADEGNQGKECEIQMESSDTVIGNQYKGIEATNGTEITAREAPLDNRWEETLQGSSTLASKQELDSIEKSKETKDESPKQENNLEFPYVADSTGEISIQKEEPRKLEDVSKMDTNEIGKESSNEELQEDDSAKEKKLLESYPKKNTSESKDADEILEREEATELTKLGKNSRTETLQDECKLQESSAKGELNGEKSFDAVSKGVETTSSCAIIEKDVLAQEDHVKNLDEIPEEGIIGGEKVENMGINLEAGDQRHERNEGFDPIEKSALQEKFEDADPSQKLERVCEVVAEDQSHENLPGAKETKIKKDNMVVEDQNTAAVEEQMIMQRLQEAEKDSINLEDTGHKLKAELQTGKEDIPSEVTKNAILNENVSEGLGKADASTNWGELIMGETGMVKDPFLVAMGEETCKEYHHEEEKEGTKVNDTKIKLDLEDHSQELDAEEDLEDKANEANKIMKCEILHEEVSNEFKEDGSGEKLERQVTEEEAMKDPSLASIREETVRDDHEGEKTDTEEVLEGLNKAGASTNIGKQIMEETEMVKDPCLVSIGEETYKEIQHEDEKEENKVNEPKPKLELEDQSREDAEGDPKGKENKANMTMKCETLDEEESNGFEDDRSSERMERQMTEEEATTDLVPVKKETVRGDNEEEKDSQEVEKEETKLNPRDQNHEASCKDGSTENNNINKEVKSLDVVLEEQQLVTSSANEVDATTIKDEADKDLDASPTPNSPAEEPSENEAVNEPKEVTLLVPKELVHKINEINEENKEDAAEGDTVEDLHPKDQVVPTNNSNASSLTDVAQQPVPEKEGHMTEDEGRHNLVILKQATDEVNLPTEETEGNSINDEAQSRDILYKEGEKMNDHSNVQETTCGYEGGETLVREQEDTLVFSSAEQGTAEESIKDGPKDHNTTTNLVIEEQSLLKDPCEECVDDETVKKAHQDKKEEKRVDEVAIELEAKDRSQASDAIEDQMEKIIETSDKPKCEILNEEVPKGLEKAGTTENMEENRTMTDPCEVSIEEETSKEYHHEDKKEGEIVKDRELKPQLEDPRQTELAGEDLGRKANETNKSTNCETLNDEVSLGTENAGSSEKVEKPLIEGIKDPFPAATGEETTKEAHQEEQKDLPEIENESTNLDPKDQSNETGSQNDATENHILNEEVKSADIVPVEQELETAASTDNIMTIKEDLDVSSTPNTPAKEAPKGEAVNEPQEAPHHEPTEPTHESVITNEENTESTTEDKIVPKEFIEVGKLKTTSSDLVSNPSNIVEDLHPKDQEVPTNKSNASSLTEVLQAKIPEQEGHMTEDEERNSWVLIEQETGETSLATGKMEGYSINNEAPVQEILKMEAKEMNDADANIANREGETPLPKQQERVIFSSIEQTNAESSIRDSPKVLDTTGNLVFEEQSHVKTSLVHEIEKTEGTILEDADTLNEKISLSDVQPADKELPQKVESVMLPEVTEISQNIGKLEKAADATTKESTQTKIQAGDMDIPSVPQHSIVKSKQGDQIEDHRPGEALRTESKEKGVEYSGDSIMEDVKPMHKKSHNILSGVGSKVMHSIARVKKVIACTHPPPEVTVIKIRK
ncbi:nuclear-pore anchor [Telopea speciosissima]|uniref:nuclear-pore anchor n=1 Tax=Telopea speciosissima TaxID=54955 RepID=UPI001CC53C1A|nr:nuclear-pore anchor [Telopea speciosissima]